MEPPVNTITERGDILQTSPPSSSLSPPISPSFPLFSFSLHLSLSLPLNLHHTHSCSFTLLSFPTLTSWPPLFFCIFPSSLLHASSKRVSTRVGDGDRSKTNGGGHGRQKQETRTLMGEDSREVVEKQKDKESECNA